MNRRLYALHRWLSAAAFLQLGIWTISGTFFTLFDIAEIRGRFERGAHQAPLSMEGIVPAADAVAVARQHGLNDIERIELRAEPHGTFYVARDGEKRLRVDARTGAYAAVSEDEAALIARRDQPGHPAVVSVEKIEIAPVEYREKPLPAWRVRMSGASEMDVYVDAATGDVTARRSRLWRAYDFLWSLHIMDYRERQSFHHPLINVAGGLALLTVLSGITLWCVRLVRRFRGKSQS